MPDPNAVNEFILHRAQGLTLVEISSRTGLSVQILRAWDEQYRPDVERVKDSVLDKVASFIFEDLMKQIALHDALIATITEQSAKLIFHPAHAEKAYESIARITTVRAKMITDVIAFLSDYSKKRDTREDTSKSDSPQTNGRRHDVL
jgi:hypothetical protein